MAGWMQGRALATPAGREAESTVVDARPEPPARAVAVAVPSLSAVRAASPPLLGWLWLAFQWPSAIADAATGRTRTGSPAADHHFLLIPQILLSSYLAKKKKKPMNSITFVLFGKYCYQLVLKDSSRDFQLNCVISYFFTYIYGSKD
jgi:hypothetical protein